MYPTAQKPKWRFSVQWRKSFVFQYRHTPITRWRERNHRPYVTEVPGWIVRLGWLRISLLKGTIDQWEQYLWIEWYVKDGLE